MEAYLGIALRISVAYLYVLLILRLSGKRTVGELSTLDFIIALMVGDMFDDVIWAEIALAGGLTGLTTVMLLHSLLAYACWKSRRLEALINGRPTPVVKNGQLLAENLSSQRVPPADVHIGLRLCGEDKLEDIRQVQLEPSGQLSVLKKEAARPVQKRDLAALREVT